MLREESLPGFGIGMTIDDFQIDGIQQDVTESLKSVVRYSIPLDPRCFRWRMSGPKAWVLLQLLIPLVVVVVYPLPRPLLVGGVRCSSLWSTSQLLCPSGQQCSHSGGVCPQIQGRQCSAYVGAVEEMMCVVCVGVKEGA